MDIALVLCPAWSREVPHLAMALLSGSLRRQGHTVFAFDFNTQWYHACPAGMQQRWRKEQDYFWNQQEFVDTFIAEYEGVVNKGVDAILASGSPLIGFSVYYPTRLMSLALARRIKQKDPARMIVFGGFDCLPQLRGHELIRDPAVDMVVMGEGEETLLDVVRQMESAGSVGTCPGVLVKRAGEILDGGTRPAIRDINVLPCADFSDFSLPLYEDSCALPLLSSRGCVQHCVYCTVNTFWQRYRTMTAERLFQEVQSCLAAFPTVRRFSFYDPLINGSIRDLIRFCELVIDATKKNLMPAIQWHGQGIIRPEMDRALLRTMKDAGCVRLSYGMESGSDRVLQSMGKRFRVSQAREVIRSTHQAGIAVALNFMFGFPTESVADFEQTQDFLIDNHEYISELMPSESFCYIDKGTFLYEHAAEFGVPADPASSFWQTSDGSNTYPERLRRFEAFCLLAHDLGIRLGSSYEKIKLFKEDALRSYDAYRRSHPVVGGDATLQSTGRADEPQPVVDGQHKRQMRGPVSFSWDMHYACNFRCPYCWWHNQWQDIAKMNVYPEFDILLQYWRTIHDRYGQSHIELLGGEPFIYPNFIRLVSELSRMHTLGVTTNLSARVDEFLASGFDPQRVKVRPTFHPQFADIKRFLPLASVLKEKGFIDCVLYLAYPPQVKLLPHYRAAFAAQGVQLVALTFWGTYNGSQYPHSYSAEERQIIEGVVADRNGEKFQTQPKQKEEFKGKRCHAGYRYAVIQPNGTALRCGGSGLNEVIGNFFTNDFALLDAPLACRADVCKCNEWAFLLEHDVCTRG